MSLKKTISANETKNPIDRFVIQQKKNKETFKYLEKRKKYTSPKKTFLLRSMLEDRKVSQADDYDETDDEKCFQKFMKSACNYKKQSDSWDRWYNIALKTKEDKCAAGQAGEEKGDGTVTLNSETICGP